MQFELSEEQELLRRSIREFAETEVRPHVMEWDNAQHFPTELLPKLAELGLMGIQFPEAYGGAGMSAVDYCICIEELARVDPSIVAVGGGAQRARRRPHRRVRLARRRSSATSCRWRRGRRLAAWGLTEPGSGSDAAAMRTTAVRDGDQWVLNGSKAFITHGHSADTMVVMAVTDRTLGSKGISAFIVERGTPGLLAGKKEDKLGMRASETCEVILQNCRVPADQLIGDEGQGFIQTLQVLDAGRIGIAALAVGLAQGAFEAARDYAGRAVAVRAADRLVPVDSLEAAGQRLASGSGAAADLPRGLAEGPGSPDNARIVHGQAVRQRERGARVPEDAVQIFGGYGFVKDYPAEKFFRDVKLTTIGEGTSEVQRLVIARQLLAA